VSWEGENSFKISANGAPRDIKSRRNAAFFVPQGSKKLHKSSISETKKPRVEQGNLLLLLLHKHSDREGYQRNDHHVRRVKY
jgi:hypothetical protein